MDYITEKAHEIFAIAHGGGVPTESDIALYRTYAVLCFAKGTETTAVDVHDAWSAWMAGVRPDHRSLKPFAELSEQTQRYDDVFVAAIHQASLDPVAGLLADPENNRALRHGIGHLLTFEAPLLPEDQKRRLGSILHALGNGT